MTTVGPRFDYALYDPKLGQLTERMRDGTASADDVASSRRLAVEYGLWSQLAAEFPAHFADGFDPAPAYTPPPPAKGPPMVAPMSTFDAMIGKTILVRMNRADGGTSVVVGTLHSVHPWGDGERYALRFASYDPQLAARMTTADDVPWAPLESGDLRIGKGFAMTSASSVTPVDPDTRVGIGGAKHTRVDVRHTAEQVIAGTFAPKVDLAPMQAVVDGKATADAIPSEYLAALKIERNALAAALIQPLLANIVAFLESEKPPPDLFNRRPVDHLAEWMFKRVDEEVERVLGDAAGAPASPMGRAFARLSKVLELESQAIPHSRIAAARTDPKAMIQVAAKTPMSLPFAMVRALADPSLLGRAPTGAEVNAILRSAIPSLMRLASSDMEVFITHLNRWMTPGSQLSKFKADALELGPKGLEFNKASLQEIAADFGVRLDTVLTATTGCPARLTVNDVNRLPKIMELVAQQLADATDAKNA